VIGEWIARMAAFLELRPDRGLIGSNYGQQNGIIGILTGKDGYMKHPHRAIRDRRPRGCSQSKGWILRASLLLLALAVAVRSPGRAIAANGKPVSWKAIDDAILRVDDGPVKEWNVYQTGKKTDPLLLQMGKRFLLIDVHDKQLFEVDPSKIERKSDDLVLWDPSDHPANPLAITDWSAGDIGASFRIVAKLNAEGHVVDLQLPHAFDTQTLPVHAAPPRRR
jgi:hypothetical protein